MYKTNRPLFDNTAKKWCEMYAQEGSAHQLAKIKIITDMGFTEQQAKEALNATQWKEEDALNKLLG